jgi:pimeloyl-ACP methyl ester carboxylesterase
VPAKKTPAWRIIIIGVLVVTGLYVVCVVGLTLAQRRLLYYPCRTSITELRATAAQIGFQPWRNAKGEFIGWFRLSQTARSQRAILMLHGNAGCAPEWFHYADGFESVEPVDFYILEYPGYGGRPGSPTQSSILWAAEDAFTNLPASCQICLTGESLGTGPACYLAGKENDRISGMFLVAPYNNLTAAARKHLPLFPVKWMLRDKFPSDEWLQNYHGPLAILLAEKDTVIPNELGRKLFDDYPGAKKLWVEPGATHQDVHRPRAALWAEVIAFWNKPTP